MTGVRRLPALLGLTILLVACAGAVASPSGPLPSGPSPSPSAPSAPSTGPSTGPSADPSTTTPTPTPVAANVATPADAAALVIATDPRFAGAIQLTPDVIGASKWWESRTLQAGAYLIVLTIGWGDCPAGCINHHIWTYSVSSDGQVSLTGESGDPIPPGGLPTGDM